MSKTHILVVDDPYGAPMMPEGILADEKYHVVTVADGYQAIEAAKQANFDVIFMDIEMPGVNGVQTFREIRKIDAGVTVIMMTASSVEDMLKETMEEGGYAIAYRPFDIDNIIKVIVESLRGRRLILMIDRQFGDREALRVMLENRGYRVAAAGDITEAARMVHAKHHDIIFLGVHWPDISGYQTFEMVRVIDPRVVAIMMTGYSEEELVSKTIENGAYTCLYKPFDMEKMMECVETLA